MSKSDFNALFAGCRSREEIASLYRKNAITIHPDKRGLEKRAEAEEEMKALNGARDRAIARLCHPSLAEDYGDASYFPARTRTHASTESKHHHHHHHHHHYYYYYYSSPKLTPLECNHGLFEPESIPEGYRLVYLEIKPITAKFDNDFIKEIKVVHSHRSLQDAENSIKCSGGHLICCLLPVGKFTPTTPGEIGWHYQPPRDCYQIDNFSRNPPFGEPKTILDKLVEIQSIIERHPFKLNFGLSYITTQDGQRKRVSSSAQAVHRVIESYKARPAGEQWDRQVLEQICQTIYQALHDIHGYDSQIKRETAGRWTCCSSLFNLGKRENTTVELYTQIDEEMRSIFPNHYSSEFLYRSSYHPR